MMKHYFKISIFLLGLFCTALSMQARADTLFFSVMQDMPLMPGLEELSEQAVIFDKPEGRIMEAVASMDGVPQARVRAYYESSLPAFGWVKVAENTYSRGDEELSLVFEEIDGHRFLRVMIAPK